MPQRTAYFITTKSSLQFHCNNNNWNTSKWSGRILAKTNTYNNKMHFYAVEDKTVRIVKLSLNMDYYMWVFFVLPSFP